MSVRVIEVAMDGGLLDGPVHSLDLSIGPRVLWLCKPVINVVGCASILEGMASEQLALRTHLPDICWCPALTGRIGKLNAIVSENSMDGVGNSGNQIVQELL